MSKLDKAIKELNDFSASKGIRQKGHYCSLWRSTIPGKASL